MPPPLPLTEDDLISFTNKFEQWKKYLASSKRSSTSTSTSKLYPSFPKFFECISSIHESFFNTATPTTTAITSHHTSDQNKSIIIAGKKKRRRDLPIENISYRSNNKNNKRKGEEEDGSGLKPIADIPNEILYTILEYLFEEDNQWINSNIPPLFHNFVRLALVSKLWYRTIRLVRTILSIFVYYQHLETIKLTLSSVIDFYHIIFISSTDIGKTYKDNSDKPPLAFCPASSH